MIELEIPEMGSLLKSPSKEELENEIEIVSTHPSAFEKVAKKTSAVLNKTRATLAKAKVAKSHRQSILEGTVCLIAALNEQAAEIGTLQAKIALLEAKAPEFNLLKEQVVALKTENAVLGQRAAQTTSLQALAAPQQQSSSSMASSYANALKRVPPNKRKAKNVSLVFAKNKDTSSEEVKETLLKALAPSKIKIGIRNVRKLAKGGVAIECDSINGTESILQEINGNEQLRSTFEAKAPAKRLPRIIIYDVDETVEKDAFVNTLISQNEGIREQDIYSCFKLKSRQAGKSHWVVEAHPRTFHSLLRRRKIFFEWHRFSLREFLRPTRCYKYNRFGHIITNCQHAETCPQCGEEGHKKPECKNEAKCINCTETNLKYKLTHEVTHAATDPCCHSLHHETDLFITRTNYGR
ncbi:hypothetical protein AVEN_272490-1 [Araneus ventricosus]|uniref:CCHC-type domain-containing protein n=1 Tax=Araneus ventricosus TaxID=182803 RepID=A0A4Y2TXN3_ARAVE|nr:hypothetical protein AVEN_272490-1 [Araneus ventricosus]